MQDHLVLLGPTIMDVTTADSWCELQAALFQDSWDLEKEKHISPYVFRGLGKATYRLKSKLARLNGEANIEGHKKREDALYRNLKKYGHEYSDNRYGFWQWWSLAQHHLLATRLMDWTYSPLVAAHFATAKEYPSDEKYQDHGVIWAVDFADAHTRIPFPLKKELGDAKLFTIDSLPDLKNFAEFDELSGQKFLVFFEPPSFDQRIVNQFAVFSVMADPTGQPEEPLEEWLERMHIRHRKIVIPCCAKPEIRQKLDQCNLSERVLFPGLEGICQWLNRHYAP
jgi:FRG domain